MVIIQNCITCNSKTCRTFWKPPMRVDLTPVWYRKSLHLVALILLPFSWLFAVCAAIRRGIYRIGIIKTHRFNVPIIVVGNITVGGTGKTPFVIWLAKLLQSQGYRPGIVSRGVGGNKHIKPYWVSPSDSPARVGDEAILLARNTSCPVVIGVDRVTAVRHLLKNSQCNIVISDDGLQHYRLHRNLEIVMVDGVRRFGNHCLLPAGPLREPLSRLQSADFVVININDGGGEGDAYTMSLEPIELISIANSRNKINLQEFPRNKIHAVAGIGHPQRFFMTLKDAGFDLIAHAFPDHHLFQSRELDFADSLNIIMTEKDAVKCSSFADERYWYLSIAAKINIKLEQAILKALLLIG
jgi:tetraacyldisaccharide 4'-kinase